MIVDPLETKPALILVVEANLQARSQLCQSITSPKCRVIAAQSSESWVTQVATEQPDLILLSISSPCDQMSIERHQQAVLSLITQPNPPAILWLVEAEIAQFHQVSWEHGVVESIGYPIAPLVLQSQIKQLLQIRHLQQQLTDSQEQVKNLEHLDTLKDEFLSTVVHELRAPLTNMKVAGQLIELMILKSQQELGLDHAVTQVLAKAASYLQTMRAECERETELIDNLLALQHLEAGVYPLELSEIDLHGLLPKLASPFQRTAANRQQNFVLEVVSGLPLLVTSMMSLERIFNELLNNACKYTPPGETIRFSAQLTEATGVQFVVSNSGVEIPASAQTKIFEKFYRVPGSDRWKQGGTGLGLALVHKLVTHLGGRLELESQCGQTTFTIYLPLIGPSEIRE
jgi:signal transduction histidine kinase